MVFQTQATIYHFVVAMQIDEYYIISIFGTVNDLLKH